MITGLYPHHHGYLHWDADPFALPTLFSVAAAHGYDTGSFVFDERYLFRDFADANVAGTSERLDGVIEWLRQRDSAPFCLWFHSWTTHMPYGVLHSRRKEWRRAKEEIITGIQSGDPAALQALRESYRQAVVRESESHLAGFLQALDELGLRDTTAIAFVSDHGESWGERYADKTEVKGTYHMHGADLFDEIVRVPLVLSAPGRLEPAVVPYQTSLVDLMPTLLELLDAPIDGLDGSTLLPLADGRESGDRPAWIVGTDKGAVSQLGLRQPPWKLVVHLQSGEEQAYRLDVDPDELESRPGEVPEDLRERVYAELESVSRQALTAEEEALVEQRLSDLGYL
jgi:arylsulfatase A-like enzyme